MHHGLQRANSSIVGHVKLVFAILLAMLCVPCSGLGVGMMTMPDEASDVQSGAFFLAFSLVVFGIPSLVLFLLYARARRHAARLQRLSAMGAASARLPLADVAREFGVSEVKVRHLVLEGVSKGLLVGRLDLECGVFVSGVTTKSVRALTMSCRACGAQSNVVVSAITNSHCQFCGHRLA